MVLSESTVRNMHVSLFCDETNIEEKNESQNKQYRIHYPSKMI